jgi:hypothetical protein
MADNNSDSEDPTTAELLNQLDDISTGMLDEGEILDDTILATDPTTAVDEEAITADTITEATPTITTPTITTPPGSRKRGVATTARTTSSSKKKKTSARCWKGARVKVTRSHLFHTHEHQNQRTNLKDMATASTSSEESHPGLESKGMQFALMLCLRAIKMC